MRAVTSNGSPHTVARPCRHFTGFPRVDVGYLGTAREREILVAIKDSAVTLSHDQWMLPGTPSRDVVMSAPSVRNDRRVLCVFPRYAPSFGTFEHSYPLMPGVRGFMPPQGILVIAASMPSAWDVRFIDENVRRATDDDFAWADAVFVSGMHIQRAAIDDINARAHAHGKVTVLGGPSVSGAPDYYPEFDYLHVGELGDATWQVVEALDASVARPLSQIRFTTKDRVPLGDFPTPKYESIDGRNYFLGSVQFSSGCPYRCEFCDIPELYGNNPRLKTPEQVTAELDAMVAAGVQNAVYFVDDNFVGNRKAAKTLLPHLIAWQKKNGYPLQFACEATLNIAKSPDLLEMMREAYFCTVFCGIETPDTDALHAISKDHNNHVSILDAIKMLNDFGMEVVSGIIMGLDTDTPETPKKILDFIDLSHIPLLTINLLQALPRTPLHRRLTAEGRLTDEPGRESNVVFKLPYEQVLAGWRHAVAIAYEPERLYARFAYQTEHTFPNRITPPASKARVNAANIRKGLLTLGNILIRVGVLSNYRRTFWRMARRAVATRKPETMIELIIHIGFVSHHLITFARQAATGKQNASFYSENVRPQERVAS